MAPSSIGAEWRALGSVPPSNLVEARVLLHHAAQLVAALGRCLAAPRPDDGHTSLEWASERLVGQELNGTRPWRAALDPRVLALLVLTDGVETGRLMLAGRSRQEAFAWLVAEAKAHDSRSESLVLKPPYALPEHPVAKGAAFELPEGSALVEVARFFANGDALLRAVADGWPQSAPVRVWPHHFDIGSVLPLGIGHGEEAPTIGVGLSPGDEGIAEPYLYVTPWPPPAPASLPALPAGGHWNVEGWTGAVLPGSEIVAAGLGPAQAACASAFLAGTVEALRTHHQRRG